MSCACHLFSCQVTSRHVKICCAVRSYVDLWLLLYWRRVGRFARCLSHAFVAPSGSWVSSRLFFSLKSFVKQFLRARRRDMSLYSHLCHWHLYCWRPAGCVAPSIGSFAGNFLGFRQGEVQVSDGLKTKRTAQGPKHCALKDVRTARRRPGAARIDSSWACDLTIDSHKRGASIGPHACESLKRSSNLPHSHHTG